MTLTFTDRNHRGITELRRVQPMSVWTGESSYYPGQKHVFLRAFCLDRQAERDFIMIHMADMREE